MFSVIPRGAPLPHSNVLQYYVKLEKCKVNDVIFPSGCEARAFNLGNKNVKIGIFTGRTRVRSKNIFTHISRYPTGKHEIILHMSFSYQFCELETLYLEHVFPSHKQPDRPTFKPRQFKSKGTWFFFFFFHTNYSKNEQ